MTVTFQHIGIQCVRRADIAASLDLRESIKVDPFNCGFDHKNGTFELNKLRLAFQVFLMPPQAGTYSVSHVPVSQVIMDSRSHGDLKITNCSDTESPFEGKFESQCQNF